MMKEFLCIIVPGWRPRQPSRAQGTAAASFFLQSQSLAKKDTANGPTLSFFLFCLCLSFVFGEDANHGQNEAPKIRNHSHSHSVIGLRPSNHSRSHSHSPSAQHPTRLSSRLLLSCYHQLHS